MNAPQLPEKISPDGSDLWDWAGKVGGFIQREARIAELRADLRKSGTVCGDCFKWMKSSECPREKNVNGYSRGPSMNGMICNEYVESQSTKDRRKKLNEELTQITDQP